MLYIEKSYFLTSRVTTPNPEDEKWIFNEAKPQRFKTILKSFIVLKKM